MKEEEKSRIRIEEIINAIQENFIISINPKILKEYNNGRAN